VPETIKKSPLLWTNVTPFPAFYTVIKRLSNTKGVTKIPVISAHFSPFLGEKLSWLMIEGGYSFTALSIKNWPFLNCCVLLLIQLQFD